MSSAEPPGIPGAAGRRLPLRPAPRPACPRAPRPLPARGAVPRCHPAPCPVTGEGQARRGKLAGPAKAGSPRSPARVGFVGVQMQRRSDREVQEPRPGVSYPGEGTSAPLRRGSPSCRGPGRGTNPPAAELGNPPGKISAELLPSNPRAAPLIPGALKKRAWAAASPISVALLQVSASPRSHRLPLRVCLT